MNRREAVQHVRELYESVEKEYANVPRTPKVLEQMVHDIHMIRRYALRRGYMYLEIQVELDNAVSRYSYELQRRKVKSG